MSIERISLLYLFADIVLILVSIYLGGLWLLNTQVAFISSMLVTFASFFSYKIMVENRVENGDKREYREFFDELEDRYGVFSEDENEDEDKIEPTTPKQRGRLLSMLRSLVSTISGAFECI